MLSSSLDPALEGRDLNLTGVIASVPQDYDGQKRFDFVPEAANATPATPFPARVRLTWRDEPPALRPGQRWQLQVRLKRPHGQMNPGGFDYEAVLYRNGVRATGYVRPGAGNRLLAEDTGEHPVARLRQRMDDAIAAALPGSPYRGVMAALAIGERDGIMDAQWDLFLATGINHLIAISGLHVAVLALILFWLVRHGWARLGQLALHVPAPKAAAVAAIVAATAYALLAGFSIPTQRSLVMILVFMAGIVWQRHQTPGHALALALFAVLLWDPMGVMDAGFWLSFGAVAIILYGMGQRLRGDSAWWKWGRVHLVVAIGLLPFMLLLFSQISVIAPVANFIAVPWVSFVVVPLVLAGTALILPLPAIGQPLLQLADTCFGWLWPFLEYCARFEGVQWFHALASPWLLFPAVVGAAWLLAPRGIPGRGLGLVCLAPVLLLAPPRPESGTAWLTLLDVGQGLSAVVQTRGHTLVFDTGPRFSERYDMGDSVLVPFLRAQGINRIDTLLVSHGDLDHIGGMPALLRQMAVKQVMSSVPQLLSPQAHAELCRAGQVWVWEGVRFEMLHPPPAGMDSDNDRSCVLRVVTAGATALLPGDIEAPAERQLLTLGSSAIRADVLVAPHHGSRTSSTAEFIAAVRPHHVLFPVGYRNRYGHPRADVAQRYRELRSRLFQSDRDGAVIVTLGRNGLGTPLAYRRHARRYWHAEL